MFVQTHWVASTGVLKYIKYVIIVNCSKFKLVRLQWKIQLYYESNQSKVQNNVQGSSTEWGLQVDIIPILEPHGWVRIFFAKLFLHLFYTCLLSLVYEVVCRAANKFFYLLFKNIPVYYQVPFSSNSTECYQIFLISSFFSATESPF